MATKVLSKHPDEVKTFGVDFVNKLASGDSLTGTPTVTATPSDLTISGEVVSGTQVLFSVSGGTDDTMYVISVSVGTSFGETLDGCVRLVVLDCSDFIEMLMMLRVLINDLDDSDYTYTDSRLVEVLMVAAKYVVQEVELTNDYTINVKQQSISPTTFDSDDQFMTLVALKAACLLDQGKLRSQALMEGIFAKCGPVHLQTGGTGKAWESVLKNGPCAAYTELADGATYSDFTGIHAVISPAFVGPDFNPNNLLMVYSY